MAALADTNILVYRFDPRFPETQRIATGLLEMGIAEGTLYIAHQAIIELVSTLTRPLGGKAPLLPFADALREVEELLLEVDVLFPDAELVRIALRGALAYQLSWFDAHMWAYAERFGLDELWSDDFQHGRIYGTVQVVNPFIDL